MNAEVYRNIAYLSADSPAVEIERWDGAGLRLAENMYLATGNSQPFSMTESPGVGLESTGDIFRRNATALNTVVPNILTPGDFRDVYRQARRRSD